MLRGNCQQNNLLAQYPQAVRKTRAPDQNYAKSRLGLWVGFGWCVVLLKGRLWVWGEPSSNRQSIGPNQDPSTLLGVRCKGPRLRIIGVRGPGSGLLDPQRYTPLKTQDPKTAVVTPPPHRGGRTRQTCTWGNGRGSTPPFFLAGPAVLPWGPSVHVVSPNWGW